VSTVRRIRRTRGQKTTGELEQSIAEVHMASRDSFMAIGKILDERTEDLNRRILALENEIAALKREQAPKSGIIVPKMRLS
jgi:hypothetical protein